MIKTIILLCCLLSLAVGEAEIRHFSALRRLRNKLPLIKKFRAEPPRKEVETEVNADGIFTPVEASFDNDYSKNKRVIQIEESSLPLLKRICNSASVTYRDSKAQPYPYHELSDDCKIALAEVYDVPKNDEDHRENVLKVLEYLRHDSGINPPHVYVVGIAIAEFGAKGQIVANHILRRIMAGFSLPNHKGVFESDYILIKRTALSLLKKYPRAALIAESEAMERALKSFTYSSCKNFDSFMNLSALLLYYAGKVERAYYKRTENLKVWIAAYATLLKLQSKPVQTKDKGIVYLSEEQVFNDFFKVGRFAEEFDKMYSRLENVNLDQ